LSNSNNQSPFLFTKIYFGTHILFTNNLNSFGITVITVQIYFLKHKSSSFTTYNLYSDQFLSRAGSEPIIRIRIQQKGSDQDPQHWVEEFDINPF